MRDKSIKIDKVYKWLVEVYAYRDSGNTVRQLDLDIAMLQHGEKSRERAVLEMALRLGLRISELRELREQGLSEEEAISEFLKGEKIHVAEGDPEIRKISEKAYRTKMYETSPHTRLGKDSPTALWYLVPLFFSLLGGLIGYVGVKEEDEEMAKNLLFFGFIMFIIQLLVLWFGFL